ncbi:hypothetical protein CDQ83_17225 [Clostridium thermosuccinogenes]|nr:hypothetical protein CDQ83_17225 [Pseudoclostridium thermosuccinogenes]
MDVKMRYYKSFLIFNQEDVGYGSGQTPSGYVRIEARDGKGKLSASVQNLREEQGKLIYKLYILSSDGRSIYPAYAGIIPLKRGRGELHWEFDPKNVAGTGKAADAFNAAVVLAEYPERESRQIICPLAAYKDKRIAWREKLKGIIYADKEAKIQTTEIQKGSGCKVLHIEEKITAERENIKQEGKTSFYMAETRKKAEETTPKTTTDRKGPALSHTGVPAPEGSIFIKGKESTLRKEEVPPYTGTMEHEGRLSGKEEKSFVVKAVQDGYGEEAPDREMLSGEHEKETCEYEMKSEGYESAAYGRDAQAEKFENDASGQERQQCEYEIEASGQEGQLEGYGQRTYGWEIPTDEDEGESSEQNKQRNGYGEEAPGQVGQPDGYREGTSGWDMQKEEYEEGTSKQDRQSYEYEGEIYGQDSQPGEYGEGASRAEISLNENGGESPEGEERQSNGYGKEVPGQGRQTNGYKQEFLRPEAEYDREMKTPASPEQRGVKETPGHSEESPYHASSPEEYGRLVDRSLNEELYGKGNFGFSGCSAAGNTACPFQAPGRNFNQCIGCIGGMPQKPAAVNGKPSESNFESFKNALDMYFEISDPFGSKRKDYKWWKVNSPVYLNNILYQYNIRTPLLFNPLVITANFKYRHLIVGIYTDKTRFREYIVCGVPGIYGIDEKPFGDMCRWVQLEGSKPKYGAFGYWLVYIDPKTGKFLPLN